MAEPKVRFKRDDGSSYPDIQQVPFGDVVKPFTEKTKTENEDVLLSCAINGVFLNTELFGHQRGASNKGYKKIRRNTLILSAQNLHLGNANVNQRFDHGIISPAYNTYDIVGCNPDYMAQWVKRDATKKFFYDATTTGASQCRRNVDWNALYEQIFYVPCEEEQQKIADFLSSVDEIITASEEEVANLEIQKKAVMKKILSQEVCFKRADGSDFPEWEYNPFEEIASLMTASIDPSKAGTMHCVELEHLEQGSGQRLGFIEAENQSSNKRLFETGDVLFGKLRPYLRKYWLATEDGCCSTEIWVLRPLSGVLSEYLLAIVSSDDFISVANTSEGTKMPRASWDLVANAEFPVPSFEEQRLIADFLSDFDEAIAAAKKELELWKELKKGLLQQMFV